MLIDTNVWGELARKRPEPRVVTFFSSNGERCFLSTILLAEIEYGIANAADEIRRTRLIAFRHDIVARCRGRVLQPDNASAAVWGKLKMALEKAGKPIADMDLMIASQAIAAGMPLVTRNVSDMARTGAAIINPWEP